MENSWNQILDFMYLSMFIGAAVILKEKIKIFDKYLIPTSILAGFIGLLLGPGILKLVPINTANLEVIVYHLMAVGFIALALKDRKSKKNRDSLNTGIFIVSTYLIQGIIGFIVSLLLYYTIFPEIFPTFGLLLPLGFGQGPGQAYSIGKQWENLGFSDGGQIGLTIAAIGFLWACFFGIFLLNYLIKKNKNIIKNNSSVIRNDLIEKSEPDEIPLSLGIDKITVQLFLIGIVYLVTYLTIRSISHIIAPLGIFGATMSQLLWGFHFLLGTVYAIILRLLYDFAKRKKYLIHNYPNNYLLQRISGASFDYMITASIAALSIYTIKKSLIPILLVTTAGGLCTAFFIVYLSRKIYDKDVSENALALFGMLTGTISTGLALLREADPDFNTGAAENLVLGSAAGLIFGFPLMIILNIPIIGYVNDKPVLYLVTLLCFFIYLTVLISLMLIIKRKKCRK